MIFVRIVIGEYDYDVENQRHITTRILNYKSMYATEQIGLEETKV